jgi:hypothetical protein
MFELKYDGFRSLAFVGGLRRAITVAVAMPSQLSKRLPPADFDIKRPGHGYRIPRHSHNALNRGVLIPL